MSELTGRPVPVVPAARRARRFPPLAALALAAACTMTPQAANLSFDVLEKTAQFTLNRREAAWAAPAGMTIVLDRNLGAEFEQRIGLVNDTTLDGDNFLWLRARVPGGYPVGRFRLVDFLSRVGQVPAPFTAVSDDSLRTGSDALGTYFYLVHRTGGETNCVLAFRRIDGALRQMPRGTSVLEVLLRNCLRGSVEQALAPITDLQIGVSAAAAAPADGGNRMLSPLAAPPLD